MKLLAIIRNAECSDEKLASFGESTRLYLGDQTGIGWLGNSKARIGVQNNTISSRREIETKISLSIFTLIHFKISAKSSSAKKSNFTAYLIVDNKKIAEISCNNIGNAWTTINRTTKLPAPLLATDLKIKIDPGVSALTLGSFEIGLEFQVTKESLSYLCQQHGFQAVAIDNDIDKRQCSNFIDIVDIRNFGKQTPKPKASPVVSILTPTYNGKHLLEKCANALIENTSSDLFEWIVLDDCSTDDTRDYLDRLAKNRQNIKVIKPDQPIKNFSKANNILRSYARGKYLVFLNNDCYVQKGWLSALLRRVEADPTIGMIGTKLLFPGTDKIQHCGVTFIDHGPETGMPHHMLIYQPESLHKNYLSKPRMYQAVTAACSLMPIQIFDAVNKYDEEFNFGYEDVDLCLKVGKLGYKVLFEPAATAYHEQNATHPIVGKKDATWEITKHLHNKATLNKKWKGKILLDGNKYTTIHNFNVYSQDVDLKSVLYIPYTRGDGNDIYRTDYACNALGRVGVNAQILDWKNPMWPANPQVIVFQRFLPRGDILNKIRKRYPNAIWGYDIDDFIFDETMFPYAKSSPGMSIEIMKMYSRMMENCHFFTTTTSFLCNEIISRFRRPCFVIPNCMALAGSANQNKTVIGYASGSRTHDEDFKIAIPALKAVLSKNRNIRLRIMGHLNVPSDFAAQFSDRIEYKPFVPFGIFSDYLKDISINIAPLSRNPFNDAKSPLKYIEAAAFKIPTIASSTEGFREVIDDGHNGFLCHTTKDWIDRLSLLAESHLLGKKIGQNAFNHVRSEFSIENTGNKLKNVLTGILIPAYGSFANNSSKRP